MRRATSIANEFSLLTKRNDQKSAKSAGGTYPWEIVLRADIGNVERAMLAHPAIPWLIDTDLAEGGSGSGPK